MQKISKGDSVIILDERPFWKNKKGFVKSNITDDTLLVNVEVNIGDNKNVIETFLLSDLELVESEIKEILIEQKITNAKQFIEHFINIDCKFLGFDYDELYSKHENEDGEYVFYEDDLEYINYFKYLETLKCKIIGCSMYEFSQDESLMENFNDSFWKLLFENGEQLDAICGENIKLLSKTTHNIKESLHKVNKDTDLIKPYLADDSDWFFVSKIAVAEDIEECDVLAIAKKFNYVIFVIFTETKISYIVAKKNSDAEEIIKEYASYLPGFKKIERVK